MGRKCSMWIHTHNTKDRFDWGWDAKFYNLGGAHTAFYIVVFFQYFMSSMLHCIDADLVVNSKLKRIMLVSELQTEWSSQNPGSFMIHQDIINTH